MRSVAIWDPPQKILIVMQNHHHPGFETCHHTAVLECLCRFQLYIPKHCIVLQSCRCVEKRMTTSGCIPCNCCSLLSRPLPVARNRCIQHRPSQARPPEPFSLVAERLQHVSVQVAPLCHYACWRDAGLLGLQFHTVIFEVSHGARCDLRGSCGGGGGIRDGGSVAGLAAQAASRSTLSPNPGPSSCGRACFLICPAHSGRLPKTIHLCRLPQTRRLDNSLRVRKIPKHPLADLLHHQAIQCSLWSAPSIFRLQEPLEARWYGSRVGNVTL